MNTFNMLRSAMESLHTMRETSTDSSVKLACDCSINELSLLVGRLTLNVVNNEIIAAERLVDYCEQIKRPDLRAVAMIHACVLTRIAAHGHLV